MRAYPASGEDRRTLANKNVLQMQKDLSRILLHVHQPNYCQDQAEINNTYDIVANINNYQHPKAVKTFMAAYNKGFLPRGPAYTSHYKQNSDDGGLFFVLFYFTKDCDTFYKTACCSCDDAKEGQLIYAFSFVVLYFQDMNSTVLSQIYDIYLYLFVDQKVIQKVYETYENEGQVITQNTYVFPTNYNQQNLEKLLSNYTEDAGLSAFYTCNYPTFMNETYHGVHYGRRGELIYNTRQQLYACYYLEHLSNGQGDVPAFHYHKVLQTMYNPKPYSNNGQEVPAHGTDEFQYCYPGNYGNSDYSMDGNHYVHNQYNGNYYTDNAHPVNVLAVMYSNQHGEYDYFYPEDVQTYEKHIQNAIDYDYVYTHVYKMLPLYDNYLNNVNYLGSIVECNNVSPFKRYNGLVYNYYLIIIGRAVNNENLYGVAPSDLKKIYITVKVLVNYLNYRRVIFFFQRYKIYLPTCSYDELAFSGVKEKKTEVSKLITFFDSFEIDVDVVLSVRCEETEEHLHYHTCQVHLNDKSFAYTIQVNNEKSENVMVQVYIGPIYKTIHEHGITEMGHCFVKLKHLKYLEQAGKRTTEPNSKNSNVLASGHHSYGIMLRKINEAVK